MANAAVNADPGTAERPSLTLTRRLRARPEKSTPPGRKPRS
ncbi:hypothetical protein ACQ5SK_18755 [Bradyrhizobium japonicum]